MTVTYGFFNSVGGDRVYDAVQLSSFLEGIISDGILTGIGSEFAVAADGGMISSVGSGKAWFKNTWTLNDASFSVTHDTAHPTLPRIDRVIIEVDLTLGVRANSIKKLTGTPASSPVAPTLIQTTTKQQYPLAQIAVAAGASSLGAVTDERDTVDCPYAEAMLAGSAEVQDQIDALIAKDIVLNDYILPLFTNKSGGSLNEGALVIFDKENAQAFKTTTIVGDRRVFGVIEDASIADDAQGNIAMTGIHKVLVQGNVAVGQALISSTTAGRAMANGNGFQPGLLGYAVTAYAGGGAGDVLAILNPDFGRAGGAITVISTQTGSASAGADAIIATNLGASANEKLVLVFATGNAASPGATATFNGVNMTTMLTGGGSNSFAVYRIQTTATGSQNAVVNISSGSLRVTVIVLEGHISSGPVGTANRSNATSANPSVNTTDAIAGDYVISALEVQSTNTTLLTGIGAGQSEVMAPDVISSSVFHEASSKSAVGAVETMSATLSSSLAHSIVSIPIHLA